MDKGLDANFGTLSDDIFFHLLSSVPIPGIVLLDGTCRGLKARIASAVFWKKMSLQLCEFPAELAPTYTNVVNFYKSNNCWFDTTVIKTFRAPSPSQGFFADLFSKKTIYRCAMIGPSKSGKSMAIEKWKTGEGSLKNPPKPTTSCVYEPISYKKIEFRFLEISGRDFPKFHCYREVLSEMDAFVFMVDSNDPDTFPMLESLSKEGTREPCECPWLIGKPRLYFCNKQDLPSSLSVATICDKLSLHSLRAVQWYIQAICSFTGDGLYEGLDWLSNVVKNR